jgi:hypothetical protein
MPSFKKKNTIVTRTLNFNSRKHLVKCYIWSIALYGVETWTLQKANHKYPENSDVRCWRGKEQISWTDHMKNKIFQNVKAKRNIIHLNKGRLT